MITEEKFIERVAELMERHKQVAIQRAKSVWESGAIEPSAYADNYQLPRYFVAAYSEYLRPHVVLSRRAKRIIKELGAFV